MNYSLKARNQTRLFLIVLELVTGKFDKIVIAANVIALIVIWVHLASPA